MSIFNAILFGIIQGLTEFFPVSSSAHLSILGNLFGMNSTDANYMMFCVFAHLGSILAIIIYYLQDIWDMIYQLGAMRKGKHKAYPAVRLLLMLLIASVPLFILIPVNKYIDNLFTNSILIGVMLILSGVMLFIADHFKNLEKDEKNISISDAIIIGICQLVGAIPGISRVGTTICASMATGHKRSFSVKFSYLLSIVSLFGVNVLHLVRAGNYGFSWNNLPVYLVGMASSFAFSLLSIKIVSKVAEHGKFEPFAYYSLVAGVLFIVLTMIF